MVRRVLEQSWGGGEVLERDQALQGLELGWVLQVLKLGLLVWVLEPPMMSEFWSGTRSCGF